MKFIQPKRLPEANVTAELYVRLKQEDISCLLEYKVKGCRFDVIIIQGDDIVCIVEVKSRSKRVIKRRLEKGYKYKQVERYETHGVPVLLVYDLDSIESVVSDIKFILANPLIKVEL